MKDQITHLITERYRELTALMLLQMEAVKINTANPFKLASGKLSPIYVNCRRAISEPQFMQIFSSYAQSILKTQGIRPDVIAGGETAGIPYAAYLASSFNLPMVYVRKAKKAYGQGGQVEGYIEQGASVLLVEDLITDGGSKAAFIDAIKEAGGIITDALVLFDRLQGGKETLYNYGINLHSLTDMDMILSISEKYGLLSSEDIISVREYLN
ncbi:MAG: orotate phosphoribosyltransferase [Nitrospirae bacterium]|nr:orotate phosphoribosyltransferase [Nitrospirota bacterium]